MRRLILSVAALALTVSCGNAEPTLTLEKYNELKTGISYQQASLIIGVEGVEISSSEFADIKTVMYTWQSDGMANMNAMFQNDKLIQKAQFGLK